MKGTLKDTGCKSLALLLEIYPQAAIKYNTDNKTFPHP